MYSKRALSIFAFVALFAGASAFIPVASMRSYSNAAMKMSTEESSSTPSSTPTPSSSSSSATPNTEVTAIAVSEKNVEASAAVVGAVAGFSIGGPILAGVFAAGANYISKKDNEVGEAARGVGRVTLDTYNYISKLNTKFDLTGKASGAVGSVFSKAKASDSDGYLTKTEEALSSAIEKAKNLNKDYDLVAKAQQVLAAGGELSDSALAKLESLNAEYKITDKAMDKIKEVSGSTASPSASSSAEKK